MIRISLQKPLRSKKAQLSKVSDEKSEVQQSFDESFARLDSMTGLNSSLQSQLTDKNSEIASVKKEIRGILNKKNATAAELSRAKKLIASLNGKIESMEQEIARFTQENETLGQEKVALNCRKRSAYYREAKIVNRFRNNYSCQSKILKKR